MLWFLDPEIVKMVENIDIVEMERLLDPETAEIVPFAKMDQ